MEIEEEDWIEYIKRSTRKAEEQMKKANIPCWIETHRWMKWRMAMRIASLPEERWLRITAEWNPGIDNCIKTNRSVGRQRKGWEDEINEFIQTEETAESKGNDLNNNDTWLQQAKQQKEWKAKEEEFAKSRQQWQEEIGTDEFKQTQTAQHSVFSRPSKALKLSMFL